VRRNPNKPGTDQNSGWNRSGVNASAIPPTLPYTLDAPLQTTVEAFKEGGEEAFDEGAVWSSTQRQEGEYYAYVQFFDGGGQVSVFKDHEFLVAPVRSVAI
jgi:hypothetical protein